MNVTTGQSVYGISDLSSLFAAFFALDRRTGQKNALRFVVGFSRPTGIARGFRDQILVEGVEDERSGWEAAQNRQIKEIMKFELPVLSVGARLQHSGFGRHLKTTRR